ncbi:hypothetical protein MRX96_026733 [Rhipicephalus microplus]
MIQQTDQDSCLVSTTVPLILDPQSLRLREDFRWFSAAHPYNLRRSSARSTGFLDRRPPQVLPANQFSSIRCGYEWPTKVLYLQVDSANRSRQLFRFYHHALDVGCAKATPA